MLPKTARLNSPEIRSFRARRGGITTPHLVLCVRPNVHGRNRFGIIVGNRAVSHAVGRNALRRALYNSFHLWPNLKCDILCVVRRTQGGTIQALAREAKDARSFIKA